MRKVPVILIGGFLGAGKTTLVAQAAQRLVQRGQRVGLITNDQAANLVDTAILEAAGSPVCEVSGGCFCCRFEDLLSAMEKLMHQMSPDVLIGEPVGSCTDLSATVLQPIKDVHRDRFRAAPFSVTVDVKQMRTLERMRASPKRGETFRFPESVMYIYQKQLEEADLIVLNKADLLSADEVLEVEDTLKREFTRAPVFTMSALAGQGVDGWLDFVLADHPSGSTIAEVDYDEYAAGEAALGWLNAAIRLDADRDVPWRRFCTDLIAGLQADFQALSAGIAHLKLHLAAGPDALTANLTSNDGHPVLRGEIAGHAREAKLLVNARVHIDPQRLRETVERRLQAAAGDGVRLTVTDLQSFAPARPQPKYRYDAVV
jgi:G3E family GTPase